MTNLTQTYLKSILDYDQDTGIFKWKTTRGSIKCGSIAGSDKNNTGYNHIQIDKKMYKAHRLAWLYVYGSFPDDQIDHIDGNRINNAILNLRNVDYKENFKNKRIYKSNISGCSGVCFDKLKNKWAAIIKIDGKQKHLGYFVSLDEAIKVRTDASALYGYHENHGDRKC